MSDLIDRQAAINVVKGIDRSFVKYIEELPSAQPEITRCKDCRFNDGVAYCEMHYRDVKGNDFCSWAERRQDG